MKDNTLDLFGELLIKQVRDETISEWDMILNGKMKGVTAKEVKNRISSFNQEQLEVLKWIVPQIVDLNLHNLLFTIEESDELFVAIDDKEIKEESDGLAGELYTEDGWIRRFSNERYDEID